MHARPSLRVYLFCSSLLLTWLPIVLLAGWAFQSAVDRARSEAEERHLMISRHLTLALDRYTRDAESVFQLAVATDPPPGSLLPEGGAISTLLSDLGFRHVCVVDEMRRIVHAYCAMNCPQAEVLPERTFDQMGAALAAADRAPGQVAWSGVIESPDGEPAVVLLLRRDDGLMAIGELTTGYVRSLQSAVHFGDKGHAAIVDARGRVLAHPNPGWVRDRKDISAVSAVQAMMRGEAGATQFHSPALKADMIAGFATVSRTGWGVMVPQPLDELYQQARGVAWAALVVAIAMMGVTGVVSWLLARSLARSFEPLQAVAARVRQGDLSARVRGAVPSAAPREFHAVGQAVDDMMDRLAEAIRGEAEAHAEARRADDLHRAKATLLAHVSHELRTPLNAIIGFSDVIRSEVLGGIAQRRYVEYAGDIQESGHHLLGLIDKLLELSRSELAAAAEADEEWVELPELAARAMNVVATASGQDRRRHIDAPDTLPFVRLTRGPFRQVLINLIENAEKYTDDGGSIRVAITTPAAGGVTVSVEDDGIGMTPEEVAVCTSPFGRAHNPLVRKREGAGLGLSVVAAIVTRLGATLDIDSEPARGTRVSVTLPPHLCRERDPSPRLRAATGA